ncbi:hypothetical protein [uncultured Kordia sp.]|uniref:hypothetical protein n=1 Tax=uncultured Kordia sp. TaxID=507699 RepID=UPI0026048FC6|nr:hypothetical protein [uncultured Kordia sp.]
MSGQNNNTAVVAHRYYPKLSSVVNTDDIPDILGFIKDGIVYLFDKIHYKDLQYNKSPRGDAAFYSLSIVSQRLDIELPSTGIYLVLNPDADDATISAFPITVEYEWQVLAYLRDFNLDNFSFSPQEFFEIALRVLNISEEQAIANFINTFTEPIDDTTTNLEQFVNDINAANSDLNLLTPTQETKLTDVVSEIHAQTQKYATLIGFITYILKNDLNETKVKLKEFFRSLLPQDIEEYIKNILIPKARATLTLSAGIEFPRSILKPVYDEFGVNPCDNSLMGEPLTELPEDANGGPKVMLTFGEALFYADTEEGFGYNLDLVLNTNFPAQIGNTGLIIDIQNLKIDLSKNSNIAEADLDNRPPEFMGVYTDLTTIYLPKKWFKKETGQTLAITGERLLIGTGGMSGTIALRATYAVDAAGQVTDYFSEYFDVNYPVTVVSNGTDENITSLSNLVAHINALDNPYQLKFKYPLSITTNTGILNFEKEADYNSFISTIDPNQFMWFQLGSNPDKAWRLGFNRFDLTFYHGQVTESNLKARVEIPKFKDPNNPTEKAIIDLEGHWYSEDDFSLTATFLPSGFPLELFNFMTINFLSAEIGKAEDKFFLGTSCEISFQNAIMQRVLGDQKIVLPKLRVYEDGSMEIVGGNAFIPTNISLNLGPIEIAVTGIHFGSHQQEKDGVMRKYNYWGFDGAISLDPLGIDARGEGIKYYYTTDNDEHGGDGDSFLRIQTIEVDLIIPGTADPDSALAIINGMLSIPEPGESPEYEGKIGLKLPKARISGAAQMRLQPKEPAFLIEAGIEMPTPIPLAATGLAFYGFGGLLGYKYVAEKEAIGLVSGEDTWYDYYTYPKRGVNFDKFSGPPRTDQYNIPVAIGAGTVLGTMHDDGYLFSTRLMAILSLPSVFILDGRANVLGERLGILDDTEPPFFAGVAVGDDSFEFWFGADYQLPQSNGWIIDLYAEVQAGFFFNNPSAWYLNFGTKDSPITARVLTIITAQSFLMLSARGIEAGARVDLSLKKNFFGIKVEISAYVEVGGFISFERFQLGGYIAFGGTISISVWKIVGFRVSLDAILSAEAARPFLLFAQIRVRVCIRIIVKICKTFKVKLKWEKDKTVNRDAIPPLANGTNPNYPDRTREAVQGVHMLTNETFELNYFSSVPTAGNIDKVIPLDTYIDFKAMKGLVPGAISDKIGGHTGAAQNFTDLIPPNKVVRGGHELRQVKHKYSIENIGIYMADGSNWRPYHPFEAVVPEAERPNVNHLRIGYWQRNGEQYDSIRLLATNPFSYMEAGEPGWFIPEEYGITPSELYCVTTAETGDCSDFLEKPLGTKYYRPNGYVGHYIDGAYYSIEEGTGDLEQTIYVQDMNWSIPLVHATNGENVDTVYLDRMRAFINGSNSYPNLGTSSALIYTETDGITANLVELAETYLTAINTVLFDNNSEPLTSFEFTNVSTDTENLNVSVRVKSDYEFASSGANAQIFSTLYLSRQYGNTGGSSLAAPMRSTETLLISSNEPTPVGCMEVTDVENNHDFAQSLQFSNADRLIIILPEASVETKLRLTTYAEGVTIRYYKTILSDTNSTPQYELIHEVYKTKLELNSEVVYVNEEELTSKITVTPKSANAHLIRAVREQIAELQEATYDSETGQIIPLTAAQQAQLEALQAELAQLEAEGCSVQTNATPKQRIVAEIYNEIDTDGKDEYRFRVYNEKCEIALSSSTRYYSKEAAINELNASVAAILNDQASVVVKETVDNRYYFNIVNNRGEVIARRIEYFKTHKECDNQIAQLKSLLSSSTMVIGEEGCGKTKDEVQPVASTAVKSVVLNPSTISVSNTIFNSYKYFHPETNSQRVNWYSKMKFIGGNFYAVGYPSVNVAGSNYNDGVLTKLDAFGKVIFSRAYYIDGSQPIRFKEIEELSDGNLLIIGRGYSRRLYYLKVDTNGTILWQRYFTCEQGLDEFRMSVVKTNKRTFFITCLSSTRDRLYVLEINENGEVINQTGLNNGRKYWYEVGASCLDPQGGLMIGIRRRSVTSPNPHSTIMVHFDANLQLKFNYLINSKSQVEITDMIMHEDRLYFILDNITTSESTLTYIPYNDKEFKEISSVVLPVFRNWKLTGSDIPNSVIVANNAAPIYRIGIQNDQSLAIDATFNFNTPTPIAGIKDIHYDGEQKNYTLITNEYLAVLKDELSSCVTIKEVKTTALPKRTFTYVKQDTLVENNRIQPVVISEIRTLEQNLQLEKELCPVDTGGGDGDCNKDETLCDFHAFLKTALFECINNNARDLFNENWPCFLKMIDSIELFDSQNPQYGLLVALAADMNALVRYPEVARPPTLDGALIYANTILDKIYELGDCQCAGDCKKDPVICAAYDELVRLYNECFLNTETSAQVDANIDCFRAFRQVIKDLANVPGVTLPAAVSTEYDNYVVILNRIEGLVGHHEQILRFRDLNESAIELIKLLEEAGDCGCNDGGTVEEPQVCNTSIQQVCWLSIEQHEYNETIPGMDAIEQEQQDMEEAVQRTAQPIWRPNSTFYVHYQLKDEVDNGAGGDTFDYYYGFKTAGPIGHFHNADGVTYGNEYEDESNINTIKNRVDDNGIPSLSGKLTNPDTYPLTSLRQYIDYDKSYPNADGNLLQAKPVFYGQEQCRITLYFTKPLAYHMLRSWEEYLGSDPLTGAMHIAIKDPVSNVTIPYPLPIDYDETVPSPEGTGPDGDTWINDDDPRIPLNIRMLNNFINYINENDDAIECTFTIGNAIKPQSYAYSVVLTNLKPQKLYTALIYNAFETESNDVVSSEQVHNYVFQTSRYQNFEAQVNSYMLIDEDDSANNRQAVFNVALPNLTTDDINTAYNIVDGNPDANSDALETQYLDVFDRLLEGVLGMNPLDPAVNTEFNKILDGDGKVIAILIRNPEPFNIPKIPIEQINGQEEIFEEGSTVGYRGAIRVFDKVTDQDDDAYKVLYSKDYSQALIMHDSKQITAETLSFKFRYLIWDVNKYVIDDTARAEDIVLTQ